VSVYQLDDIALLSTEDSAKSPTALTPITATERIAVIDILRGFAVFGILLVNIGGFMSPDYPFAQSPWTGAIDQWTSIAIRFFVEGKFFTLFSFLFGLGFSIQMARAEDKGVRFVPLFLRRLAVLMLIGLAHCLLLWEGDILHNYAEIGLLLLLFRRRKQKTVLIWAIISITALLLFLGTLLALTAYDRSTSNPQTIIAEVEKDLSNEKKEAAETLRVYSRGTFAEMVKRRVSFMLPRLTDIIDAHVLMMFLLGLYVGRSRILEDVDLHELFIRRVRRWALPVGIIANIAFALLEFVNPIYNDLTELSSAIFYLIGGGAFCLVYASTIVLLNQDGSWHKRLSPLAAVGQMALSNYLLHSLICSTIFYSYGLGLFGRVRPVYGLLMAVVIFAAQTRLSVWWLSRFKQGPVEWLWRTLTYGKRQPLLHLG
jgi:uncharacterized protein